MIKKVEKNGYETSHPLNTICYKCGNPIYIKDDDYIHYFKNNNFKCHCNNEIDLYKILLKTINDNFMFCDSLLCLGAKNTAFKYEIQGDKINRIILKTYGIPENSRILQVNYTPECEILPLELQLHSQRIKIYDENAITFYPMPIVNPIKKGNINVSVIWIDYSFDDHAFRNLTDAFEFYTLSEYEKSIVPANVAVENSLSLFITNELSKIVGKDKANEFLRNAATYNDQLNIILPLILKIYNLPPLSDSIRGNLNRLRDLRNQIAHYGKPKNPIEKNDCAEVLCSTLFGYKYIKFLNSCV
jgi:hypothetical protein